ncbi:hypothetical protein G3O08_20170 [Cryomorpha ignava]|uniref:Uncharacterized protein n=1 Tax=Cryomorpha ignava TaxID=101383 RepID=A0A7K3WVS8_9FLAO|nr:hypothetical protein [Cryomorpha ignava]NEN25809.1 hypothetical protein [Cryomorpha ignava]
MKKIIPILIIGLFLISGSCEKNPFVEKFYTITIINQSSQMIYFLGYDKFSEIQYPDTTLPIQKPNATILGHGAKFFIDKREPWSEEIDELPADTISFFFFDKAVFEDSLWTEIKNDYLILKRYDLSLQDLENLDFNIPYPPVETMEGMQIYPPE